MTTTSDLAHLKLINVIMYVYSTFGDKQNVCLNDVDRSLKNQNQNVRYIHSQACAIEIFDSRIRF